MAGNLLDPNLSYGWTNQQAAGATNLYGSAGLGYGSVSGVSPAAVSGAPMQIGQSTQAAPAAGFPSPNPTYSGNVNAPILLDPGFADGEGNFLGQLSATTIPALPAIAASTTAVSNPSGLAVLVTVTGGTVTSVATAPFNAAGAGSATFTTVATATGVTVTVPPAGFIKLTYSVAPTWSWVTTN